VNPATILVDMDGVLADWDAAWDAALDVLGEPAATITRSHQRTEWNLNHGLDAAQQQIVADLLNRPGYYADLPAIDGGRAALREMRDEGHDVRIVTSPWVSNPTCASDKLTWVVRHLGQSWGKRTIITNDKTLVRGDYLIDDKPEISGAMAPTWEHVYFDRPTNRTNTTRRRLHRWADWRTIVDHQATA
jgi:5'-nucleotidase